MEDKDKTEKSINHFMDTRNFFTDQTFLLFEACLELIKECNEKKIKELLPLIYCATFDSRTILGTSSYSYINGAYIMARAMMERIINFCYLQIAPQSEYDNFIAYSKQKEIRVLDYEASYENWKVSLKHSGVDALKSIPEYKEALDKFSNSKGKEKTRWTKISVIERASIIDNYIDNKPFMLLPIAAFYTTASEALHGTLFGASFQDALHEPDSLSKLAEIIFDEGKGVEPKETIASFYKKKNSGEYSSMFLMLGTSYIHRLFILLNKLNINSIDEIFNKSSNNTDNILEKTKEHLEEIRR